MSLIIFKKTKKPTALAQNSGCKFMWVSALCSSLCMLESERPEPPATAPVPSEGNQKPAGGNPVMKDADGGTWDFCTIKFVRTESHCSSLSLSKKGDYHPYLCWSTLAFMNIEEVEQSVNVNLSFFEQLKKKIMCCYFSTSSVFPHAENILELSAPVHDFPDFSFFNTPKQEGRSRKQNNIHFTESRKLTQGVKIVHEIGIFSVDGCTWTV